MPLFTNSSANLTVYTVVHAHEVTNVQLGVRTLDEHRDVSVWARNIFDTNYYISRTVSSFNTGLVTSIQGNPRTFGVSLRVKY